MTTTRAQRAPPRRSCSSAARLLLAAANPRPGPDDVIRAHAALSEEPSIEWQSFVPLARRHGVLPLLHRHLSTGTFDARLVPAPALARLRQEAESAARRSLLLAGELIRLVGALGHEGIRVVPLKGPILGQQLYGSAALRRTNDLDLLVAEENASRATALIAGLGFRTEPSWDAIGDVHRDVSNHVILRSSTQPYRVELHYLLHPPVGDQRHTLAAVEDDLEPISFFGTRIEVMRPEALLVYLCAHGTRHAWARIEWVGAVAELLRSGRVRDWDRVRASARRLAAERALTSGLLLVHELFDIPMPSTDLHADRPTLASARAVARRLTEEPERFPDGVTTLINAVRVEAGIRRRVARVWSTLFVPTLSARLALPLPRVLQPLYYVLRPASILVRRVYRRAFAT